MNYVRNCLIITMLAGIVYATCPPMGELNGDGSWNVLDILLLRDCVLATNCLDLPSSGCNADMNGDGHFNVIDIVNLAGCVLASNCDGW